MEKVSDLFLYAEKLFKHAGVYLMLSDGMPCGITCFYANDMLKRTGFISLIGVKAAFRRGGYVKKLILYTESKMLEEGMTAVRLEVAKNNLNAIGFYRHMGYTPDSETENGFYMVKDITL